MLIRKMDTQYFFFKLQLLLSLIFCCHFGCLLVHVELYWGHNKEQNIYSHHGCNWVVEIHSQSFFLQITTLNPITRSYHCCTSLFSKHFYSTMYSNNINNFLKISHALGCSFDKDRPTPTIMAGIPHPNTEYKE